MTKVESRQTLHQITRQFLKRNKHRNIISISAIVLTTVMFCVLFIAGISGFYSMQNQLMKKTMMKSHLEIENITQSKFEKIIKNQKISSYGYSVYLGNATNEKLKNHLTQIGYADKNGAKSVFSYPIYGHMPKQKNEIAMSTITLNLLKIPHKLGETVHLEMNLDGISYEDDFVLSGYWTGDTLFSYQRVWTSNAFQKEHAKTISVNDLQNQKNNGAYSAYINGKNLFQIKDLVAEFDKKYRITEDEGSISMNEAYDFFDGDSYSYSGILIAGILIFLAGYFIIYNIFQISVMSDIKIYGQLKNIGTTGKQLKKIVLGQAFYLCVIAIPIGLILGILAGKWMAPYFIAGDLDPKMQLLIIVNPAVLVCSALFSTITVYISCLRPSKIVARLTPIEALRYQENTHQAKNKKRFAKKQKEQYYLEEQLIKAQKVSVLKLALQNVMRNRIRFTIVVLSLSLPIIILNCIYMIWRGFDFDKFISTYISTDYNVSGCSESLFSSDLEAITPTIEKAIAKRVEVKKIYQAFATNAKHTLSDQEKENLLTLIQKIEEKKIYSTYDMQKERNMVTQSQKNAEIIGISKSVFEDHLTKDDKSATWEQFKTGNYIMFVGDYDSIYQLYHQGDKVNIQFPNGKQKEYTVLTNAEIPYDLDYPFGSGSYFAYHYILPEKEYIKQMNHPGAMILGIDVKKGQSTSFGKWMNTYIKKTNRTLYIKSKDYYRKDCEQFANQYYAALASLGSVIFMIGILNFFNTMSISVSSRKREFALFEAIGMTKNQMKKVLILEGLSYTVGAFFLSNTVGLYVIRYVIDHTAGRAFYFTFHLTLLANVFILPIFVMIAILIPLLHYKKMQRETVVERLRYED